MFDEDRVADAVGARAAVATTVVSSRSIDESRLIDDAAPVTSRRFAFGRDGGPARYDGARQDV